MSLGAWIVTTTDESIAAMTPVNDLLERHLEDWILARPEIAWGGITWVARQLVLGNGRLDLLGLTPDDQWVVAELKSQAVGKETLVQALGYVVQLGSWDADDLARRLEANPYFATVSSTTTGDRVRALLATERDTGSHRRVAILLAGTGRDSSVDVAADFLSARGLDIPVTAVAVSVFANTAGQYVLVREVEESIGVEPGSSARRTIAAVLELADSCGVGDAFRTTLAATEQIGLRSKPWPYAITITVRRPGSPTVLYLRPEPGIVHVWVDRAKLISDLHLTEAEADFVGDGADLVPGDFLTWLAGLIETIKGAETRFQDSQNGREATGS